MSKIKDDESIKLSLYSSLNNKNKRKLKDFYPRSSSVTLSKIRQKNLLKKGNSNNDLIFQMNIPHLKINKNNLLSAREREREIKSERLPFEKNNYFNNNKANSISIKNDLLEKIDIFIENDLIEEEEIEENNKIKSVLNSLIFWDNEHLTDRKGIKSNTLIESMQKEKSISFSKRTIEKNYRKKLERMLSLKKGQKKFLDQRTNSFKLKEKILHGSMKNGKEIHKFDFDNNPKYKENTLLINLKKERKRLEISQREELKKMQKKLIINKIKKNKYNEVLNNTYQLLVKARTEYNLSIDLLEKRIQATQKYYEAIIKDFEIQHHLKNSQNRPLSKSMDNDINNNTYKKVKTKINKVEIYEAKIKSYREYLSIVEDINKEIKIYDNKFNNIQSELKDFIIQINNKLAELCEEKNKLKIICKELSHKEIQYYLSLLKAGTDTRADGLSWIIKRLMELDITINYSMFPNFLDTDDINYLIKIAKLEFEKAQIKRIIENLKQSQKNKKTTNIVINNETVNKKDLYNRFKFNINSFDNSFYYNNYGSKLIDQLIARYNSHYIKKDKLYDYKKQNSADKLFVKKIKDKINIFAHNKDFSILNKENNKEILNINKKEREAYYNLFILNEREKEINIYINNMRKREYLKFKEKFKAIEIKELAYKQYYRQVFNALFGKNNFEISSFSLNDKK